MRQPRRRGNEAVCCPHCLITFHANWNTTRIAEGATLGIPPTQWICNYVTCPACKNVTIDVLGYTGQNQGARLAVNVRAVPKSPTRHLPPEVPPELAVEFTEACMVLGDSERASAALSRRCLQNTLVSAGGAKTKDLFDQIEELIPKLPAEIADSLHAVRNIGNFAAHAMKSKSTGQIVDVEPGEAEWNLDTLEELFDFYFVRPAAHAKRKTALNLKLKDIGKPTI